MKPGVITEISLRIGLRRGRDITALGVQENNQSRVAGVKGQVCENLKSGRTPLFEQRNLRLDRGHASGRSLHNRAPEGANAFQARSAK